MLEQPDGPKLPKILPLGAQIIQINTVAMPVQNKVGGVNMNLLIIGLGDDNMIYKFDANKKIWIDFQ